jgi:hypothetical protein
MAIGDRVEKRMFGPEVLSATAGSPTITTVSTGYQWTTKQFVFTNTSGSEALVYVSIGAIGTAGNRVLSALPIAGNDVVVWDTALVVNSAETVQAYADRTGVNMTMVGWEKQVS